jgi:tungstate transport system substrate-binding protein
MKKILYSLLLVVFLFGLAACAPVTQAPPATEEPAAPPATEAPVVTEEPVAATEEPEKPAPENPELILATTTSTRDSGLLDVLLPIFEEQTGYLVKMIAVGTGEALTMGEEGNADVLMVHAPSSEVAFMENGFGKQRELMMHNDFVLVGPETDLVGIKNAGSAVEALTMIADAQAPFATRADDSGTHKMEVALWGNAGITPEGEWYIETGQGMADTLKIASEKYAYTLTDRATYLFQMENLDLDILYEGDPIFLNIYHVITVNPDKWPLVNAEAAQAFLEFCISPETQAIIKDYGTDKFGQPLFIADYGKDENNLLGEKPALKISGNVETEVSLSSDDLAAMTMTTVNAKHPKKDEARDYTGVLLGELLALAKPGADAAKLTFVASDGYTSEVAMADVLACADCLVELGDEDSLNAVMPGMDSKAWAKYIVEIVIE